MNVINVDIKPVLGKLNRGADFMREKCPNCGYELDKRGSFSVDDKGYENWIKWQYYCKICDYSEGAWRQGEEEDELEDLEAEANSNYRAEAI